MTIPLLSPETVKNTAAKGEQEARIRVRDLALEEERLVKSINDLRAEETQAKNDLREKVAQARNDAQVEMNEIELAIAPLRAERVELMKPIDQLRIETEEHNRASEDREHAVTDREHVVTDKEKELSDREAILLSTTADRNQLLDEREKTLNEREEKVRAEEQRVKDSLNGVNERWAQFHTTVAAKEEELIKREAAVNAGEQANQTRSEQLDKREIEQKEHDRQIADRYETLASAEREIIKGEVTLL